MKLTLYLKNFEYTLSTINIVFHKIHILGLLKKALKIHKYLFFFWGGEAFNQTISLVLPISVGREATYFSFTPINVYFNVVFLVILIYILIKCFRHVLPIKCDVYLLQLYINLSRSFDFNFDIPLHFDAKAN